MQQAAPAQQPYTSSGIRAAATAAAAAVDPMLALATLARGGRVHDLQQPQPSMLPPAAIRPAPDGAAGAAADVAAAAVAAAAAALVPEAESATPMQQAGMSLPPVSASPEASIAQAQMAVTVAVKDNGGSVPAHADGEEDRRLPGAGPGHATTPAMRPGASDNAADSGSATSLPHEKQQQNTSPAAAPPPAAGAAASGIGVRSSPGGAGVTGAALELMHVEGTSRSVGASGGKISKQASFQPGLSAGKSGELPFTSTDASAHPRRMGSSELPCVPQQAQHTQKPQAAVATIQGLQATVGASGNGQGSGANSQSDRGSVPDFSGASAGAAAFDSGGGGSGATATATPPSQGVAPAGVAAAGTGPQAATEGGSGTAGQGGQGEIGKEKDVREDGVERGITERMDVPGSDLER